MTYCFQSSPLSRRNDDPRGASRPFDSARDVFKAGDYARALSSYKKALELDPGDPKIQQNYARFAEFYSNYTKGRIEGETGPKKLDDPRKPPPGFSRTR